MAGVGVGQKASGPPGPLLAALKSQAPPSNPATPNERINPQQTGLEHLKAASISLERSKEFIEDPLLVKTIDAMSGAITKALLQFDGTAVLQALQSSIGGGEPPAMAPPGAPGMGAAPPAGGPQPGASPSPAAPPVSPFGGAA